MSNSVGDVTALAALSLRFARVDRASRHPDGVRPETDADHTVMLALVACAFAAARAPRLDLGLIAQFSTVHDLVEAYSGDVMSLGMSTETRRAKEEGERVALERIRREFATLPWIAGTIDAYERLDAEEARFVKILDKAVAILTHLLNGGAALRGLGIHFAQAHAAHLRLRETMALEYPQAEALALYDEIIAHCAAEWGVAP